MVKTHFVVSSRLLLFKYISAPHHQPAATSCYLLLSSYAGFITIMGYHYYCRATLVAINSYSCFRSLHYLDVWWSVGLQCNFKSGQIKDLQNLAYTAGVALDIYKKCEEISVVFCNAEAGILTVVQV